MAVSNRHTAKSVRCWSTMAALVAGGVFTGTLSTASASFLEFRVQELTTNYDETFTPAGTPQPLWTQYSITGLPWNTSAFNINGFVNGSPDLPPPSALMLGLSLTFANQTSNTLEFIVTMTLHGASSAGIPSEWNTSASWSLAGPNDAELSTLPGLPLWTTYIDGGQIATLYDPPTFLVGPGNLNTAPKNGLSDPVAQSIGLQLAFSISGNSSGGPTGGFQIIPAPGAIALLGFGLLGMKRRRRD